jgi:hypothetical protein
VSPELLRRQDEPASQTTNTSPMVSVFLSDNAFRITDCCGGIEIERAREQVFRFGRTSSNVDSALGVYGIGLKRAVFKIGKQIIIESRTLTGGFTVQINVDEWSADDGHWQFPISIAAPASSQDSAGTTIMINDLNPEVVMRIRNPTLLRRLSDAISSTYALFLQHFLTIELNETPVRPRSLPIASSDELPPARKELRSDPDEVVVELFAGLAVRSNREWNAEQAGWYVLCNGRVVVAADKTELTGWGLAGPQYVSKYRGFVGIAFFFSRNPGALPWTTTKRGLNQESLVYQVARREMTQVARPVLTFLNNMYPSEPAEEVQERRLADNLRPVDLRTLAAKPETNFSAPASAGRKKKTSVSVQYTAEKADIERIKNKVGHPDWSAGAVGRFTFERYLKVEFSE